MIFYDLTPPPINETLEAIEILQETMEDIFIVLLGMTERI